MLIERKVLARKEREREDAERRRVEQERRLEEYFGKGKGRGGQQGDGDELEDSGTGGYWDQEELDFFLEEAMGVDFSVSQPWDRLITFVVSRVSLSLSFAFPANDPLFFC